MNKVRITALFIVVIIVSGCSILPRIEEVVPQTKEVTIVNHHNADVRIDVTGGDELSVSSEFFRSALMQTLNTNQVFSSAKTQGDSQYEIIVLILSIEKSWATVEMVSLWILRTSDGTEVWSESIEGNGSSSSISGAERVRAATEGAVKATIIKGVENLNQLSL